MNESPEAPVELPAGTPKTRRVLVIVLAGALLLGAVGWGVWRSPIFHEQRYRSWAEGISTKYKVWEAEWESYNALGDSDSAMGVYGEALDYTKQLPDVWRSMTPPDKYAFIHDQVQEGLDSVKTASLAEEIFFYETWQNLATYTTQMDLVDSTEALGD